MWYLNLLAPGSVPGHWRSDATLVDRPAGPALNGITGHVEDSIPPTAKDMDGRGYSTYPSNIVGP